MLAVYPIPRTPRLASQQSQVGLRIYSPTSSPARVSVAQSALRCGEPKAIGELLPQVLARYLSPRLEEAVSLARG